jgi:uncharacterized protein YndB with AHSA1/START domain
MSAQNSPMAEAAERELVIERVFDAPRELVFKVFSEPEHLSQWWGPKGWTLPVCKMDFQPGGIWHYCMQGPNGEKSWGKAVYQEIVAPERIVYTDSFSDEAGNAVEGMPEMLITLEFNEQEGKTKIISRTLFATAAELESIVAMGAVEGMKETWDRLEAHLAQVESNAVTITRVFDAPRELVFKAWTDPEHVAQWWGPHGFTNPVCELDVRPGGSMLIHMRAPDGSVYPNKGIFNEVVMPERLVFTDSAFDDEDGNPQLEVLNTVTFSEHDGKTTVTLHAITLKVAPAMAGAHAGMEEGWGQSFDRLAEHLG